MSTTGLPSATAAGDQGVSLRAVIDARKRLDELGTARLVENAAELVHKAQPQGQPLGTLSPETILVRGGRVALDKGMPVSAYTAPERLRGGTGDRRSDVFSLGVILWEALAHVRLFDGATDDAVKAAVLAGNVAPVTEMNANVPAELDAICKKALARDPADRYQSAKVMAAEISAVLDDAGYPEGTDAIQKWIATELADGGAKPAAPKPLNPTSTVMGIAPLRVPEKPAAQVVENKTEPLSAIDLEVVKPKQPDKPAEKKPELPKVTEKKPAEAKPSDTIVDAVKGMDVKAPVLPAWATKPPTTPPPTTTPSILTTPPETVPTGLKLPATPPGATIAANTPPAVGPAVSPAPAPTAVPAGGPAAGAPAVGSTTIIAGSGSLAPPPTPAPAKYEGTRTAVLGSNAIIEATNAAVSAANPPAAPAAPAKPELPTPFKAAPRSIANAETVTTPPVIAPELASTEKAPATKPAVATAAPSIPPPADDDFAEASSGTPSSAGAVAAAGSSAADAVAPPRARRATSRGDQTGSKQDMLGGWGWGTDAHEAIDDDAYEDDRNRTRKRLIVAIGSAGAAVLLIVVIAFAMGGSSDKDKAKDKQDDVAAKASEPAPPAPAVQPDPAKPTTEPVAEPPKAEPPPEPAKVEPEPAKVEPAKVEPEPAKVEPAKVEPPKVEPAKVEPPKVEPPKVEPPKKEPKKEPAKIAKEVPKKEPPRKEVPKKEPPKKVEVAARKDPPKKDPGKPLDPYQPAPLKLDAAAAYRNGLQQFARGDSSGALATFKASLASDPGFAPTWRGIGLVYEKLGKRSQATTAFKRYLQLSPNAGDADQIKSRLEKLGS